jgi:LysM repeat protein
VIHRRPSLVLLLVGALALLGAACSDKSKPGEPSVSTLIEAPTGISATIAATPLTTPAVTATITPSPAAAQSSPPGGTYTIKAGDTLPAIAARVGSTVAAILAANPGLNPNRLRIGQQINLPATADASGVPPATATVLVPPPAPPPPPPSPPPPSPPPPLAPCTSYTGGRCITQCNDGQWSSSIGRDACSGHGGEVR